MNASSLNIVETGNYIEVIKKYGGDCSVELSDEKGKYIITVFEGLTEPVEGILIIVPPIIVELFNQDIYDSYPQIEEKEITQIKDYVYILFSHEEKWDYI